MLRPGLIEAVVPKHGPPQSLWNHGCCDIPEDSTSPGFTSASITLESRVLRRMSDLSLSSSKGRLNHFGITGAATEKAAGRWTSIKPASITLESRVLRPAGELYPAVRARPPQSLWNHGCCDTIPWNCRPARSSASITLESRVLRPSRRAMWITSSPRLNHFGITGAATLFAAESVAHLQAASITLESRVLRREIKRMAGLVEFRLNHFGITGAATADARVSYTPMGFCCAREHGAESVVPLAWNRAENARRLLWIGTCERSLGSDTAPQHS